MKLKFLSLLIALQMSTSMPAYAVGKWAIVMLESGKFTEVYADECFNRYAPPVQISQGLWRIENPHEQTIHFICVKW